MLIILPFLTTCFGNLLRNYSLEGGLKSLFSFDSNVLIDSSEPYSLYFSATLSTTFIKTPFGYFPLRI